MSIRTILTKLTLTFCFEVFAPLCLVIIVGDVKHFHLYLKREGIFLFPEFFFAMRKVTSVSNMADISLLKVLAKRGFVQIIQLVDLVELLLLGVVLRLSNVPLGIVGTFSDREQ
jgi:hypothetical protein